MQVGADIRCVSWLVSCFRSSRPQPFRLTRHRRGLAPVPSARRVAITVETSTRATASMARFVSFGPVGMGIRYLLVNRGRFGRLSTQDYRQPLHVCNRARTGNADSQRSRLRRYRPKALAALASRPVAHRNTHILHYPEVLESIHIHHDGVGFA